MRRLPRPNFFIEYKKENNTSEVLIRIKDKEKIVEITTVENRFDREN